MLGKFIAGDFIAIAGETWDYYIIMIIRGLKTNLSV
jgi:hypothetical protein